MTRRDEHGAALVRDQGKRHEAREVLAPVYGWFTEGFDPLDLPAFPLRRCNSSATRARREVLLIAALVYAI